MQIIAEIKKQSPFGFYSSRTWDELFSIADDIGDIISIHTHEDFGGCFDDITKAAKRTNKPILAKGFHYTDDDVRRALDAGATYVLVVGRLPSVPLDKIWIEPVNLDQLAELNTMEDVSRVVWNDRDLYTGQRKKETFGQARKIYDWWLCQASFIRTIADVKSGADAIIVGSHLPQFVESYKKEVGYILAKFRQIEYV